jgi:hypothetical protein
MREVSRSVRTVLTAEMLGLVDELGRLVLLGSLPLTPVITMSSIYFRDSDGVPRTETQEEQTSRQGLVSGMSRVDETIRGLSDAVP